MSHTHFPFVPVDIGVFRPRPARPIRASGTGDDGSDPPFLTAGAVSRMGGCPTGCHARCHTPSGVAPVRMYPCRKADRPARWPDGPPPRGARGVTNSSAPFSSSAASGPRPRGHDQARFPRPIPWPCSSAFTRRTFTAPASRGTTSRPAGPCSSPGNSSSAHHGVGSPGWASVWGAGPACRRGHFRPRPGARVGGDDPQAEARVDAHPAAVTGRGHDDHAGTRVTPDGHRRVQQP